VRLGSSRADTLRLPCFVIRSNLTILPAFTHLAGGHRVRSEIGTLLFPVTGGRVIPLT